MISDIISAKLYHILELLEMKKKKIAVLIGCLQAPVAGLLALSQMYGMLEGTWRKFILKTRLIYHLPFQTEWIVFADETSYGSCSYGSDSQWPLLLRKRKLPTTWFFNFSNFTKNEVLFKNFERKL